MNSILLSSSWALPDGLINLLSAVISIKLLPLFNLIFMEEFYLNDKKKVVLNQIINSYLNEGLPVGAKTLSTKSEENVSSSSLRNVMAELESLGLIYSPHVSSGRLPT